MKPHLALVAAIALTGVAAPAASASTITLGMDTAEDPAVFSGVDIRENGTVVIGMLRGFFLQRYVARVTADDGLAVTTCLTDGAVVKLVDSRGAVRASSASCPDKDGLFEMRPVGKASVQTPSVLRGVVSAPTFAKATLVETEDPETGLTVKVPSGPPRPVAASTSNLVLMRVEPNLVNESPKRFSGSGAFPVQMRVAAPSAGRSGTFVVRRKKGDSWVRVSQVRADKYGRMKTAVTTPDAVTTYSIRFVPANRNWLPATFFLSIRRVTAADQPAPSTGATPTTSGRILSVTRG